MSDSLNNELFPVSDYSTPRALEHLDSWSSSYSGIVRSISTTTFNIQDFIAQQNSEDLLSVNLSLSTSNDSNASFSGNVPPKIPIPQPKSTLDPPRGRRNLSIGLIGCQIITTSSTSSQLKLAKKQPPNVRDWVKRITSSAAPGHQPWSETDEQSDLLLTSEGSVYPRELLHGLNHWQRHPLRIDDRPLPRENCPISPPADLSRPRTISMHREALVFECQVTLSSAGAQGQRCSLQVPADAMQPEMVGMMLELQDLNSFFGGEPDNAQVSTLVEVDDLSAKESLEDLPVKTLLESFPLVPDSLPNRFEAVKRQPLPLAARRGRATPSHIIVQNQNAEEPADPYSTIPSAFLGTSITNDPGEIFRLANANSADVSMDILDMMRDLRARCDPLKCADNHATEIIDTTVNAEAQMTASNSILTEDEWAFANDLLKTCKGINVKDFHRVSQDDWAVLNKPPRTSLPPLPSTRRVGSTFLRLEKTKSILKPPRPSKCVRFALPDELEYVEEEDDDVRPPSCLDHATSSLQGDNIVAPVKPSAKMQNSRNRMSIMPPPRPNSLPVQAASSSRPFANTNAIEAPRASLLAEQCHLPRDSLGIRAHLSPLARGRPSMPERLSPSAGAARRPSPLRNCCTSLIGSVDQRQALNMSPTPRRTRPGLTNESTMRAFTPSTTAGAIRAGAASQQEVRRSMGMKRVPIPSAVASRGATPRMRPMSAFTGPRPAPVPGQSVRASLASSGVVDGASSGTAGAKRAVADKENRPAHGRVGGMLTKTANLVGFGGAGLGSTVKAKAKAGTKDALRPSSRLAKTASKIASGIATADAGAGNHVNEVEKTRMPLQLRSVLSAIPKARQLARARARENE